MLITLGVVSSAVVFAAERGNNDLVLFALAIGAAALAARSPRARLAGYAMALLAGLLKYYPMTLMLLATRERPRRFLTVAAASLGVVALFLATMGRDLQRALQLIPTGGWFGDMFGSSTLPGGLARLNDWPPETAVGLRVALAAIALGAGVLLARTPRVRIGLGDLSEPERMTLLAGSLLILSCFFTAQNIGYRALHLVLVLPALAALWRMHGGILWPVSAGLALALLWAQGWRNWLQTFIEGRPGVIATWAIRETLWWLMVSILIGLAIGLLARSTMARAVLSSRHENTPADHAGHSRALDPARGL
jgi:hypothetical protein